MTEHFSSSHLFIHHYMCLHKTSVKLPHDKLTVNKLSVMVCAYNPRTWEVGGGAHACSTGIEQQAWLPLKHACVYMFRCVYTGNQNTESGSPWTWSSCSLARLEGSKESSYPHPAPPGMLGSQKTLRACLACYVDPGIQVQVLMITQQENHPLCHHSTVKIC